MAKGTVSAATILKFEGRIEPGRIKHILDSEELSNGVLAGGHRFGQATRKAKEGKFFDPTRTHTEFPESWSDDKILENTLKVIDDKDIIPVIQSYNRHLLKKVIDGVEMSVVIDPTIGRVVTSFPLN